MSAPANWWHEAPATRERPYEAPVWTAERAPYRPRHGWVPAHQLTLEERTQSRRLVRRGEALVLYLVGVAVGSALVVLAGEIASRFPA